MKKGSELENDLEKLNKSGANFFSEQELKIDMGAIFSREQNGYVLGSQLYRYISDDLYKRVR